MSKFSILLRTAGHALPPALTALVQDYEKRLVLPYQHQRLKPKQSLLDALPQAAHIVLLDPQGQSYSTEKMATLMASCQNEAKPMIFLIGGAAGVGDDVRKAAHHQWAFGTATFPHQLVHLLVMEQIYRMQEILRGNPYHKG